MSHKKDFRNLAKNQLDKGQIEKFEFSTIQSAKKVFNTSPVLKDVFTHFYQEVDSEGRPVKVVYYQGTTPAIDRLNFTGTLSGGEYYVITSPITGKTYSLYQVVSGTGSAPSVSDVELPVITNLGDSVQTVSYANYQVLKTIEEIEVLNEGFVTSFRDIRYKEYASGTPISLFGGGNFSLNRIQNSDSEIVGSILLDYDSDGNPIYNGNTLKGLLYNPYTASFDVERSDIDVNVTLDNPKSFSVETINIPLANTEYLVNIPDGTRRFKLKDRDGDTKLKVSNQSGGDHFTLHYGNSYEESGLTTDSVTLYIQSSKSSRTLELITWS